MLNIGFLSHFSFPKTLFPSFLHHHCLQFLYPTNFLVRECFSLLFSSIFNFIVDDFCEYWQVLTSYSYDVPSLIEERTLMHSTPPPHFNYRQEQTPALKVSIVPKREDSNSSTVSILEVFLSSFVDVTTF